MRNIILMLFIQLALHSCNGQDCQQIPVHFDTYKQAILFIKVTTFKVKDAANTSISSWIRSASYYSCNGTTGYFIFKTDSNEYIHSNVPLTLWNQFKRASSLGSFYNMNIKGRYKFNL
jgi:uncharacterized protein with PQ loop repeat